MNALAERMSQSGISGEEAAQSGLHVMAELSYIKPTKTRPCSYTYSPPPGVPWESAEHDCRMMPILDGRLAPTRPSIEREGFELRDAPTAVGDFTNPEAIATTYYREAAELVRLVTGAKEAYVFDHLVRRRGPKKAALTFGKRSDDGLAAANGRIHNDYTEASGRRRLELVLTDPITVAGIHRYSIINIWRPIRGPVLDTPLALCDARTFAAKDLVVGEVKYPQRTGEIYFATHSNAHRWSYFPEMSRHEALVFKQYDSQISGVSRFTPHAAFDLPDVPPGVPPRESIELRCLVTYQE